MDNGAEETARAQADAQAQTDIVDHERLARLVGARRSPVASPSQVSQAAPPKKSSTLLITLALAAGLALVAIIASVIFLSSPANDTVRTPTSPSDISGPTDKPPIVIKPELIKIPGGTFQVGRDKATILEGPPHTFTVPPFEMDRTEVTNAEYEVFVRETGYAAPGHWANNKPLANQEQWPVTNVSYDDAVAFAVWRSKRDSVTYQLPTEQEWEFAARNGEKGDLYPWGNDWEKGRAVIEEASPKPVGSLPNGKNRWGVMDLIGNVWEWTSSKGSLYPGNRGSIRGEEKEMMVYRGGSHATKMRETPATAAVRNWQKPSTKHPTLGFRLVRPGS